MTPIDENLILLASKLSFVTRKKELGGYAKMVDEQFKQWVQSRQAAWRFALITVIEPGIPMPAMSASLANFDAYRSARLPANIIQAQRDYFGAHTFERIDRPGSFHADWYGG